MVPAMSVSRRPGALDNKVSPAFCGRFYGQSPLARALLVGVASFGLAHCRGCGPQASAPAPSATSSEEPVRPAMTAALPVAQVTPSATILANGPPVVGRDEVVHPPAGEEPLAWFANEMLHGRRPLGQLLDQYPAPMRRAAEKFLYCSAAHDANQCSRLFSPGDSAGCRILSAQLRMRARGTTGWGMPDEALPYCHALQLSESECRALGLAAEQGNATSCAALQGPARAMCESIGTNNGSACGSLREREARNCARLGREHALLREGVNAVRERDAPNRAAMARGLADDDSCETTFRIDMRDVATGPDDPPAGGSAQASGQPSGQPAASAPPAPSAAASAP